MAEIVKVDYREQNEYYNPDKCHDGGGYSQPYIEIEFLDGTRGLIDDTSCGDFGSRIFVTLYYKNKLMGAAEYGSMYKAYEEESTFNWRHRPWLDAIREVLGYRVPTDEDIKERMEYLGY